MDPGGYNGYRTASGRPSWAAAASYDDVPYDSGDDYGDGEYDDDDAFFRGRR